MLLQSTDELNAILDGFRLFLDREVIAIHEREASLLNDPRRVFDESGRYTTEVRELQRQVRVASARAGFFNMFVPEELGGEGLKPVVEYWVWEFLYRYCGPNNWLGIQALSHWVRGASPMLLDATEAMKELVLPGLLAGDESMCFAMSEPDAGSDPWMMATKATEDGSGWRVTGTKQWITNGPYADYVVVFAVTNPERSRDRTGGISAFIIPTDSPGFSVQSVIRIFGEIGGDEAILHFDDVHVNGDQLLGTVDDGFRVAMSNVSRGRLWQAAKAVGLARWALAQSVAYADNRVTFGSPLSANQGVMFPLADTAIEIRAAHLMGLNAAYLVENGYKAHDDVAMAKGFAAEVGVRAMERAMQVHGGMGFSNEIGLFHGWHELRRMLVSDGSSEIIRRSVSRSLLRGNLT